MKQTHPLCQPERGMTLIEVMFATAIFTVVLGTLFAFSISFSDTAQVQEIKVIAQDEARRALQAIAPDLRQAVRTSINWTQLPGEQLAYSVATDLDGNGTAVDQDKRIEISLPRVIGRDLEDVNGDGLTSSQLIVTSSNGMQVLANNLAPESEQAAQDGTFGAAQDLNGNGQLDRGIWFEASGRGVSITVQTVGETRQGIALRTTLQETVYPRN